MVFSPFVGWKYSPDQPKPLRRGQHGESIDFIDELRKYDPELEHFRISEDSEEPEEVKSKNQEDKKWINIYISFMTTIPFCNITINLIFTKKNINGKINSSK